MSEITNQSRWPDYALLVMLTAVVYGRLLGCDFQANYDDNWVVLFDESVRGFSWSHIRAAFTSQKIGSYVPLETVSFMLDYTLWGLKAGGFHLTNILLHTACGLLLYRLIMRLYRERLMALVASAVFLVHPVQVESVAWITQRRTSLCMIFFLLTWEFYCRYREAPEDSKLVPYCTALTLFICALLSKSIAVILPVLLVLFDLCFLNGEKRFNLKDKIPFVVAALSIAVLSLISQSDPEGARVSTYHGGSALATFYTMLTVFCRYLTMLVWPSGLSIVYAPSIHTSIDAAVVGSAFMLVTVLVVTVRLLRIDLRIGFWVSVFFIGLMPVSQIIPLHTLMNDRYLYFPMLGVAALAGTGAVELRNRFKEYNLTMIHALVILPLLTLAALSYQRGAVWKDTLTLFTDAVAKEPGKDKAWEVLGGTHKALGNTDAALQAYQRGYSLNPNNTEILYGLGELYTETGALDQGSGMLKKLLEIKPRYVTGWASLGTNYLKKGDYDQAERSYREALRLQPEAWQVMLLLGNLELERKRADKATELLRRVELTTENEPESAYLLACAASLSGSADEALSWLELSFKRGFANLERLTNDKRLAFVAIDPRFQPLIRRNINK